MKLTQPNPRSSPIPAQANNRCFLIVNGAGWMWTISALIWLWLLLFLLSGNRGRLILTGLSVLAVFASPNVDRAPTAVGEARAVMQLRRLTETVESYGREHPTEGFPATLPNISEGEDTESTARFYKIGYTISRSNAKGPIDRFLIQATPVWPECGFVRSFTASEDGEIHFTVEPRPATKSDEAIAK